jgi:hypothetical protein
MFLPGALRPNPCDAARKATQNPRPPPAINRLVAWRNAQARRTATRIRVSKHGDDLSAVPSTQLVSAIRH